MKLLSVIKEMILREYNEKFLNQIIQKFKGEIPDLEEEIIRVYINRFVQIKNSPNVTEKDITKYSWKQLETIVDSNQPKRIRVGKMNDGEPGGDSNLIYNENGLRIYIGKTKNACIKYGNGYSFCISSRGEGNLYFDYRHRQKGTPYFIFDDTKSSEQNDDGDFIDIDHLFVLFVHEPTYKGGLIYYTVTTADNQGEEEYDAFNTIEEKYPRLKGMKELFKPVEMDPKEKKILELDKTYNTRLSILKANFNISNKLSVQDFYGKHESLPFYDNINTANKFIDDEINGNFEYYEFHARSNQWNESFMTNKRIRDKEDYNRQYNEFILYANKFFNPDKNVKITVTKIDLSMQWYKDYLLRIKKIVDEYRGELSKVKIAM